MKLQRAMQQWGSRMALAAALFGGTAMAQGTSSMVKDDLFAGTEKFAKGASDVTEVIMDPDTLDMVDGKEAKRAHNMLLNVVRTYEYEKPGMYNIADVEEIRQRVNTGDWHCSVHTRDSKNGESTDICNKRRTDGMVEQAIITVEPKELTFIHTIRRRNGEGSSLEGLGVLGIGDVSGLPPAAMMAMMRPEMNAQMAEMRANGAEMMQELPMRMENLNGPEFKEQIEGWNSPEFQFQFHKLNSPEFQKQMQHSGEQMELWQKEMPSQELMQRLPEQMKPLETLPPVAPPQAPQP